MADMGNMVLKLDNFDLLFNMTSNYSEDYNMTLNVTYVHASIQEFDLEFDGLNDFIYVINGWINWIFGIVANRVKDVVE